MCMKKIASYESGGGWPITTTERNKKTQYSNSVIKITIE
jgi:hypothetical protein